MQAENLQQNESEKKMKSAALHAVPSGEAMHADSTSFDSSS
jgi:hypothetical protein